MTSLRFRAARPDDAESVAQLHADSWRRHYRGAYKDAFLDGDAVIADRRSVWTSRLAAPVDSETVLAEDDGGLVGFVHVVLDRDERWGSLVDNLHVTYDRKHGGVGADTSRVATTSPVAPFVALNAVALAPHAASRQPQARSSCSSPSARWPRRPHAAPR